MVAKRTWGRYATPFNCISDDLVSVVPVVSGGSGGFVPAVSLRCFGF